MFPLGVFALIFGYGMVYSGVSQISALFTGSKGVGLFQAFGVHSPVGFDLTSAFPNAPASETPVPTQTGNTPQPATTPPVSGGVVQV